MTFTKSQPGQAVSSTSHRIALVPEIVALKKRRLTLIFELASLADQIKMIDDRLHNLRIYEQVGRIGEESETAAEAAAASTKEAGEA